MVALVLGMLLVACGTERSGTSSDPDARVPATSRAVAAVIVDRFPGRVRAEEVYEIGDVGRDAIGADVWYGGDGEQAYDEGITVIVGEDPREQDLRVGVDELLALVDDPRLGLTTTPEVLDAAEDLEVWQGE